MIRKVYENGEEAYRQCECISVNRMQRIMEKSGITEKDLSFENYKADKDIQKYAKQRAVQYALAFEAIRDLRKNSIVFLGKSGSGKTHLSVAIANSLISKGISVRYMQYRETITNLKQALMKKEDREQTESEYQKMLNEFKEVDVLLIDDLFKGKITTSDINIMFELINHRYLKRLPIIISSEYTADYLLQIDEAIGSRMLEMCKDFIIHFDSKEINYRLRGI